MLYIYGRAGHYSSWKYVWRSSMKKNNTPIISWKVPRVHEVPTSWKGQSLSDLFLETSRSKTQSRSIPMTFVWNFPGAPFYEVSAHGHGTKKTGSCKVGLAVSSEAKQARRVAGMIWPPDFRLGKQNDSERRGCSETLRDHKQNMTDSIWFIVNAYDFSTLANTSVYIFISIFNYLVLYQLLSKLFTYTTIQILLSCHLFHTYDFTRIASSMHLVWMQHHLEKVQKGSKRVPNCKVRFFHYLLLHESQVNMLFIVVYNFSYANIQIGGAIETPKPAISPNILFGVWSIVSFASHGCHCTADFTPQVSQSEQRGLVSLLVDVQQLIKWYKYMPGNFSKIKANTAHVLLTTRVHKTSSASLNYSIRQLFKILLSWLHPLKRLGEFDIHIKKKQSVGRIHSSHSGPSLLAHWNPLATASLISNKYCAPIVVSTIMLAPSHSGP